MNSLGEERQLSDDRPTTHFLDVTTIRVPQVQQEANTQSSYRADSLVVFEKQSR